MERGREIARAATQQNDIDNRRRSRHVWIIAFGFRGGCHESTGDGGLRNPAADNGELRSVKVSDDRNTRKQTRRGG